MKKATIRRFIVLVMAGALVACASTQMPKSLSDRFVKGQDSKIHTGEHIGYFGQEAKYVVDDPKFMPVREGPAINAWTGEPIHNPNAIEKIYLTDEIISLLKEGIPNFDISWSTAIYEKPYNLETVHRHAIRWSIAFEIIFKGAPDGQKANYAESAEGLEFCLDDKAPKSDDPKLDAAKWLKKNVLPEWIVPEADFITEKTTHAVAAKAELFAFYTSPSYVKGTLPKCYERKLDAFLEGQFDLTLDLIDERLPSDHLKRRLPSLLGSLEKAMQPVDSDTPLRKKYIIGPNLYTLWLWEKSEEKYRKSKGASVR